MANSKRIGPLPLRTKPARISERAVVESMGSGYSITYHVVGSDGKSITVENDNTAAVGGNPAGRRIEHWDKR